MRDNRSLFYYLYKLTGLAVATAKSHNELQKNEKCEFFSIIQKWNSHRKAENDIIRAQAVSKWFSLLLIYPECIQIVYVYWSKIVMTGCHFCAVSQGSMSRNSKGILKYSFSMTYCSLLTILSLPLFVIKAFF